MSLNIKFYINKVIFYYNKSYFDGLWFKRGDRVYLLQRNIKTTRPSNKLNYKKIKPFKILEQIGIVNYRLELLGTIRINLVFYALLLKPVPPNAKTFALKLNEEINETIEYEVEKIIGRTKWLNSKPRYRVR